MRFFSPALFVPMRLGKDKVKKTTYSTTHLKQVLFDVKEHGQDVSIRFRLLGELWQANFVRVVNVVENRALVNDEVTNKLISIDLSRVIQFEIDYRFKGIEPHNHYDVAPDNFNVAT